MMIALLQALYQPDLPLPWQEDDYHSLLEDIELFAMSSQVYYLLKGNGQLARTPIWFQERLKANYTKAMHHNLFMKVKEEEILHIFERKEQLVIPLKGIQFAEKYFGHFAARVTSDFDIFVPANQLEQAIALLQSQGYEYEITKEHHARLHKDGLMIELHWTLDKLDYSDLQTDPFWQSAGPLKDYKYVKQLSVMHSFYFICLHGARHQMDSIRYLLDIVQMLHTYGEQIDYAQLMNQSAKDKNTKRMQAVLSIVYDQFPHLHRIKALPFEKVDSHWDYTVIRSARLGIRTKQYYMYKLFFRHLMFDTWKHRMKSLRKAY